MKPKHLWFIIIGVVVVWIVAPLSIINYYDGKVVDSGTFGDTFGVVTALFSSLAFALLIYTAWMQKEELGLQREELKLTREELAKSAEAQAELVQLTYKQLNLQEKARRHVIKPEIVEVVRVMPKTDKLGYLIIVALKAGHGQLFLRNASLEPPYSDNFYLKITGKAAENYVVEGGVGEISINRTDGKEFSMNGKLLFIQMDDIDGNEYEQTIFFDGPGPLTAVCNDSYLV